MQSVFVTGTDTEVGKTRISAALIDKLQQQGRRVAGMKPIASGCEMTAAGLRNDDALALMQVANVSFTYEQVNPFAFAPAIAPHIAAQQIGKAIDITQIQQQFEQIQQQVDCVVVEGAGGWYVPLDDDLTMADLAQRLGLPVVVVVAIRLGCINHALLTVRAIEQSGLCVQGWVANIMENTPQQEQIIDTLKHAIAAPCLGEVPPLQDGQQATAFLTI